MAYYYLRLGLHVQTDGLSIDATERTRPRSCFSCSKPIWASLLDTIASVRYHWHSCDLSRRLICSATRIVSYMGGFQVLAPMPQIALDPDWVSC